MYLWWDNWHTSGPLLLIYGNKVACDAVVLTNSKVSAVIDDSNWKSPSARSNALVEIQAALCSNQLKPNPSQSNLVIWTPSANGEFTIKVLGII